MSLARFRLRHGQRSADADPRSLDVDGSDPPSRHASIGIGEDGDVHPHRPLRCGVAPSHQSCAGRPSSAASRRRTTARGNAKGRPARSSRRPLLSARFPVPCPGTVPRAPPDAPRLDGRAGVARMNRRRRSGGQPLRERALAGHSARSASLARPALTMRRCRWGGQRGQGPPPASAGEPRSVAPRSILAPRP